MIKLIISADDFGMSPLFNKAIFELLMAGRVTSTSVMINRTTDKTDFLNLHRYSKLKKYSVGLHLDFKDDLYELSINQQLKAFINIFDCYPSHIDVHKGIKHIDSFPIIHKCIKANNIPFRNHGVHFSEFILQTSTPFYYATGKDFMEIKDWINNLEKNTINEIVFHPGYYDANSHSSINEEREVDYNNIVRISDELLNHRITLINYQQMRESFV